MKFLVLEKSKLVPFLFLFLCAAPVYSWSKYAVTSTTNTLSVKNSVDGTQKNVSFSARQIYCHTTGLRQKPVAVFLYGQAEELPVAPKEMLFYEAETEKFKLVFSKSQTCFPEEAFSIFPVKAILSALNDKPSHFSKVDVSFLMAFPDAQENVHVHIKEDSFSLANGPKIVTVYGKNKEISFHVLEFLKVLTISNLQDDQQACLPLTPFEVQAFVKRSLYYSSSTYQAFPQRIDFWFRPQINRGPWHNFPTPALYDKDCFFVLESALEEELSHVLANATSSQNCYNQDGKQARILFVWESDLVACRQLLKKYAQRLNENYWNIVILNDLGREYTQNEENIILNEVLDEKDASILNNLIMVYTPVSSPEKNLKTLTVKIFKEVSAERKIVSAVSTFKEEQPVNEAVLSMVM